MDLSEVECAVPGSRYIPYTPVNGTWLHAAEDRPWLGYADPRRRDGRCDDARLGAGGHVDLKLGHHAKDGVEIIDVQAKSTCIPRRGCGSCSSTWSARAATSSSSTWTRSGSSTPPASGYWSGPEAGAGPRPLAGSGLHAAAGTVNSGVTGAWSTLNRGATGDARASSANSQVAEFLGEYVSRLCRGIVRH